MAELSGTMDPNPKGPSDAFGVPYSLYAGGEYNPVRTATTEPGKVSILGTSQAGYSPDPQLTDFGQYDFLGGPADLSGDIVDPSTLTQTPGLPDFSSMDNSQLSAYLGQGSLDWTSILSGLSGLAGGGASGSGATGGAASGGSSGGALNWLESLLGIGGGNAAGGLSGLGPYAAVGAYGLNQAQKAQKDAQAKANELKGLGTPYLDASKGLLDQFQKGTLRPEQQQVVDFASAEGQKLIDSGQALSTIAQQAYQNYQSGKLPTADEQRLKQQTTTQKQELRQRLASSGISDSSILAGYDQQIDAQEQITRQQLLDARFSTGNQAYDEWLKSTTAGQALKMQGGMFAQEAFQSMMNDALALGAEGMQPVMQSVALAIQSDQELSQQVSDLIGNLAAAWAYQQAGKAGAPGTQQSGGASGGGGGSQSTLQKILGGLKSVSNWYSTIKDIFGFDGAGGQAANVPGAAPGFTPSNTGAPAAIDSSLANLGNINAGGMFGSSAASALGQNAAGSIPIAGAGALDLAGIGAGAMFGTSAASALGASAPAAIDLFGAGATDLAGVTAGQMFGTSATGALAGSGASAGASGASAAAAGGTATGATAGAASQALGTLATGVGYAGAVIAAGELLHHAFNANASKDRNRAAFEQVSQNWPQQQIGRIGAKGMVGVKAYNIPGKGWVVLSQDKYDELAGNWFGAVFAPDGNQQEWQQKLADTWNSLQPLTAESYAALKQKNGGSWDDAAAQKMFAGG